MILRLPVLRSLGSVPVLSLLLAVVAGCDRSGVQPGEVVVYTSVDQVYAVRVFKRFTEQTGVRVRPVFDTEAGKTTGLFRRLMAERNRPRADVFWNGEICRTIQLARAGLGGDLRHLVPDDLPRRWVDPEGRWAAFSLRARVIVYNPEIVAAAEVPRSLADLTLPKWRARFAMANPLFGTTATHVAALYEVMGDEQAETFLKALKANEVRLVEGNSVVRDVVARGEVAVGLTDSDDVFAGIQDGKRLGFVLPDQDHMGTFAIPNSVLLVAGGPNPETAEEFVRFLLRPEVEELLAYARARQIPVRPSVPRPDELKDLAAMRTMRVDYGRVAARMPNTAKRMEDIFLR